MDNLIATDEHHAQEDSSLTGPKDESTPREREPLHILTASPDAIIQEAERLGLIGDGFNTQFEPALQAARDVGRAIGIEVQPNDAKDACHLVNVALTRALMQTTQGAALATSLEELSRKDTRLDQEVLNAVLSAEGIYYDLEGEATNLIGFLRSYYSGLVKDGIDFQLVFSHLIVKEDLNLQGSEKGSSEKALEIQNLVQRCMEQSVPIPKLVITRGNARHEIPLLSLPQHLQKGGALGSFMSFSRRGQRTGGHIGFDTQKVVTTDNRVDQNRILNLAETTIHELDHAIYYTLRDTHESQVYEELDNQLRSGEEDEDALKRIKDELRPSQFTSVVSDIMGAEGLAVTAQASFVRCQARGLQTHFPESGGLEAAAELLTLSQRYRQHISPGLIFYSVGSLLAPVILQSTRIEQRIYTSDIMDRLVQERPDLFQGLIRRILATTNASRRTMSPQLGLDHSDLSRSDMEADLTVGMKGYSLPFVIGPTYFTYLRSMSEYVSKLSKEDVISLIEGLKSKSQSIALLIEEQRAKGMPDEDILETLYAFEGPIKDSYDKKIAEILPPEPTHDR